MVLALVQRARLTEWGRSGIHGVSCGRHRRGGKVLVRQLSSVNAESLDDHRFNTVNEEGDVLYKVIMARKWYLFLSHSLENTFGFPIVAVKP